MKSVLIHYLENEAVLEPDALCPELVAYNAPGLQGLWERAIADTGDQNAPIPFWCLVWPGARALARWILDHPEEFAGRRVLDAACGSGLAAIAATRVGAHATGVDLDPNAIELAQLTAKANGVNCRWIASDLSDHKEPYDVILAGDVFYNADLAQLVADYCMQASLRGTRILTADPQRAHVPRKGFVALARYKVPVPKSVEGLDMRETTILTPG